MPKLRDWDKAWIVCQFNCSYICPFGIYYLGPPRVIISGLLDFSNYLPYCSGLLKMTYLIYARVSPKGSTWASSESSIQMQIDACKSFLRGQSSQTVKDEFYTAKDTNRPGLHKIISDLESGSADWDTLIVYKLDRLTRSLMDGGRIFQLLRDCNKGFVSVTENIDFSSPMGRAMLGIISNVNSLQNAPATRCTR
jgi:hypothetical protein